jgi:ligand-binding sensor domain-containing protein
LLFAILAFLTPIKTKAQISFSKKTFTTDNGLSSNLVQHITQDSAGFLWMSTWDGLSRYDGYEFKNYFHKPNDPNTFPFFVVEKTFVDKQNTLWVICPHRSLTIYNRTKDTFERFKPDGEHEFIADDVISGNEKDLWMINGLESTIYRYNMQTKEMESFQMVLPGSEQPIFSLPLPKLIYDNKGDIWVISIWDGRSEIYKTNFIDGGKVQVEKVEPLSSSFFEPISEYRRHSVYDIYISENGTTCFFTTFGLFYYSSKQNQLVEYKQEINTNDFSGKPNFYWSSLGTGINVLDTKTGELLNIKTDPEKHIPTILIDSQNNIWSGDFLETYEETGLTRNVRTPNLFKHYLTENIEFENQHIVVPIVKDKFGDTWIGTKGLNFLMKIKADGTISKLNFLNNYKGNNNHRVISMVSDSLGIWMGCTQNLLAYYDYCNSTFTHYYLSAKGDDPDSDIGLHNILKVKNNIIINGFNNRTGIHAIYSFNTETKVLKTATLLEDPCLCIVKDDKDGFWLGSIHSTIIHLNADLKQTQKYMIGKGENLVEHICLGDSSDVWAALMGGGLVHFNLQTEEIETFTTADGLSSNTVSGILKDKKGNLWLSTNKWISRFNLATKHFRNFGKAEGVLIREFNSDSHYQKPDGEMFFGGIGGMISFNPDSVEKNLPMQEKNRLLITEFRVSGIPRYFDKPVYEADTIRLQKGDNNFQLTFASINFRNADEIKYRYRFTGKNNAWIETDHLNRNVNSTNLVPGRYNLEIETTNTSGQWNSATDLQIVIPPYFYQTLLFKLLVLFFTAAVVAAIVFLFIRQIRLVEKQKQDKLRLESLRGQMNPHFIFNSLNSINYFISNNDKISANRYIADFSRLIRAFLNNLSNDYVPLEKELESLEDYLKLEHLRFRNKFDYILLTDKIADKEDIEVFPGMVQPFIENAIWHGVRSLENRKGFIRIEFVPVNESKIQCIIEDDGIGRKQAKLSQNKLPGKKSLGIVIVKERLRIVSKIMNTDYRLSISDAKSNVTDSGTVVIIDLPVK